MKNPKVSILVPVYRVEDYLCAALDSILTQTLQDLEVICADEGEDDACYDILQEYAAKDSRVKVLHKKHGGYGPALAAGLAAASGEYVGFIDPDDTVAPTMFAELTKYADSIGADIVKSPWIQKCPEGRENIKGPAYGDFPKWILFDAVNYPYLFSLHPSIWAGIYRRDFLNKKQITFTDKMFSDQKFRVRTLLETDRIGWYDKAFYKYTLAREGSATLNWNYNAILDVWLDVHKIISASTHEAISQFLIKEEFLCLVRSPDLDKVEPYRDEKLFAKLKKCLSYTSELNIENSPVLEEKEKQYLLVIKKAESANAAVRELRGHFYKTRRLFQVLGLRRSRLRNMIYRVANFI